MAEPGTQGALPEAGPFAETNVFAAENQLKSSKQGICGGIPFASARLLRRKEHMHVLIPR